MTKRISFLGYVVSFMVVAFFISLSPNVVHAHDWEMVYKHDGAGNTLFGDLGDLINAIRNGADVQVVVDSSGSGQYIFKLQRANVNLSGNVVEGAFSDFYPSPDETDLVQRKWFVSTTGEIKHIFKTNPYFQKMTVYYPVTWYVDR